MATNYKNILLAGNVKGILERQWSRKKSYMMKWKQLEFIYLADKESAGGECEAAMIARIRYE